MDPAREPLAGGGLHRRPATRGGGAREPSPRGHRGIRPDIDPPPRPRPGMQKLAIAAIVVLACLQFLPATHLRDPSNPRGGWIRSDGSRDHVASLDDAGSIDVFSWISCLDLRTLAVLANSTLTSSSDPHNISFHFLIPEGDDDNLSYHKLKVILPDENITVTSQKEIKDKINVALPEGNFAWLFKKELSPLLIGTTKFSKKRYIYTAADSIIKGKIEDLAHLDLGNYAIGAVEDCSKRISDHVSMDVLNALQRTSKDKGWVSKEPYDKDACLLDFDVALVDPRKLENNLVAAIMWWANAVPLANPRDQIRLAIALTFYDNYVKLPTNWKRVNDQAYILNYDGPKNVCSEDGRQHEQPGYGQIWQQYFHRKYEALLSP